MHVRTCMYICVRADMCVCVDMHAYVCVRVYMCTHVCMHVCIHVYAFVCVCVCKYWQVGVLSAACMCFQESVLSFHLWVLRTELGSSGLSANTFKKTSPQPQASF